MLLRSPIGATIEVDDDRAETFIAAGYTKVTGNKPDAKKPTGAATKSTSRKRRGSD